MSLKRRLLLAGLVVFAPAHVLANTLYFPGTEAAAVTAVVTTVASLPAPPKLMRVDRPYVFVIRERLSGNTVFMGKIVRMPTN